MQNSKKSFKELVLKMEKLTENQEGQLKGGFTPAYQFVTELSSVLGNNCKCRNSGGCSVDNMEEFTTK